MQAANRTYSHESAVGCVVAQVVRDPELRRAGARRPINLEAGLQHPDDSRTRSAGAHDLPAQYRFASAIAPLPVFITEDGGAAGRDENVGVGWLWHRVGIGEIAPQDDVRAHQPKEIRRYQRLAHEFRSAIFPRHEGTERCDAADILENLVRAVAEIEEICVGESEVPDVRLAILPKHQH